MCLGQENSLQPTALNFKVSSSLRCWPAFEPSFVFSVCCENTPTTGPRGNGLGRDELPLRAGTRWPGLKTGLCLVVYLHSCHAGKERDRLRSSQALEGAGPATMRPRLRLRPAVQSILKRHCSEDPTWPLFQSLFFPLCCVVLHTKVPPSGLTFHATCPA